MSSNIFQDEAHMLPQNKILHAFLTVVINCLSKTCSDTCMLFSFYVYARMFGYFLHGHRKDCESPML